MQAGLLINISTTTESLFPSRDTLSLFITFINSCDCFVTMWQVWPAGVPPPPLPLPPPPPNSLLPCEKKIKNKRLFCLAGHYFSKEKAEKEMWRQKKPRCVKRIQKRKKEKSECKGDQLIFFFHHHWRQQSKKERKNERKGSSSGSNRLTSFWSSSSYTSCLSDIDDFIIIISLFQALPHKEIFQLGIQGLIATPSLWAGFKNRHFCPRNILIKPSIAPGSATRIFCST